MPAELAGERLDKALATLLGVSRAEARYLVEEGVTIDGDRGIAGKRVHQGSVISAPPPPPKDRLVPEEVDFGVLSESDEFLVVDKPPGLVVHPGSGTTSVTLASGLLQRYPELEGVGAEGRWGLVHRLDRDTSGTLLVARTESAHRLLIQQLKKRLVKREYVALVDGIFDIPTGTVDAPIGRDPSRPTRRAVVADGKPATTHFQVVTTYQEPGASLLDVQLETGRTHQIRVHMAAIDHPVIGDRTYGRGPTTAKSPRIFLHAASLEFSDPSTGDLVRVESPLPQDLVAVLDRLAGPDLASFQPTSKGSGL